MERVERLVANLSSTRRDVRMRTVANLRSKAEERLLDVRLIGQQSILVEGLIAGLFHTIKLAVPWVANHEKPSTPESGDIPEEGSFLDENVVSDALVVLRWIVEPLETRKLAASTLGRILQWLYHTLSLPQAENMSPSLRQSFDKTIADLSSVAEQTPVSPPQSPSVSVQQDIPEKQSYGKPNSALSPPPNISSRPSAILYSSLVTNGWSFPTMSTPSSIDHTLLFDLQVKLRLPQHQESRFYLIDQFLYDFPVSFICQYGGNLLGCILDWLMVPISRLDLERDATGGHAITAMEILQKLLERGLDEKRKIGHGGLCCQSWLDPTTLRKRSTNGYFSMNNDNNWKKDETNWELLSVDSRYPTLGLPSDVWQGAVFDKNGSGVPAISFSGLGFAALAASLPLLGCGDSLVIAAVLRLAVPALKCVLEVSPENEFETENSNLLVKRMSELNRLRAQHLFDRIDQLLQQPTSKGLKGAEGDDLAIALNSLDDLWECLAPEDLLTTTKLSRTAIRDSLARFADCGEAVATATMLRMLCSAVPLSYFQDFSQVEEIRSEGLILGSVVQSAMQRMLASSGSWSSVLSSAYVTPFLAILRRTSPEVMHSLDAVRSLGIACGKLNESARDVMVKFLENIPNESSHDTRRDQLILETATSLGLCVTSSEWLVLIEKTIELLLSNDKIGSTVDLVKEDLPRVVEVVLPLLRFLTWQYATYRTSESWDEWQRVLTCVRTLLVKGSVTAKRELCTLIFAEKQNSVDYVGDVFAAVVYTILRSRTRLLGGNTDWPSTIQVLSHPLMISTLAFESTNASLDEVTPSTDSLSIMYGDVLLLVGETFSISYWKHTCPLVVSNTSHSTSWIEAERWIRLWIWQVENRNNVGDSTSSNDGGHKTLVILNNLLSLIVEIATEEASQSQDRLDCLFAGCFHQSTEVRKESKIAFLNALDAFHRTTLTHTTPPSTVRDDIPFSSSNSSISLLPNPWKLPTSTNSNLINNISSGRADEVWSLVDLSQRRDMNWRVRNASLIQVYELLAADRRLLISLPRIRVVSLMNWLSGMLAASLIDIGTDFSAVSVDNTHVTTELVSALLSGDCWRPVCEVDTMTSEQWQFLLHCARLYVFLLCSLPLHTASTSSAVGYGESSTDMSSKALLSILVLEGEAIYNSSVTGMGQSNPLGMLSEASRGLRQILAMLTCGLQAHSFRPTAWSISSSTVNSIETSRSGTVTISALPAGVLCQAVPAFSIMGSLPTTSPFVHSLTPSSVGGSQLSVSLNLPFSLAVVATEHLVTEKDKTLTVESLYGERRLLLRFLDDRAASQATSGSARTALVTKCFDSLRFATDHTSLATAEALVSIFRLAANPLLLTGTNILASSAQASLREVEEMCEESNFISSTYQADVIVDSEFDMIYERSSTYGPSFDEQFLSLGLALNDALVMVTSRSPHTHRDQRSLADALSALTEHFESLRSHLSVSLRRPIGGAVMLDYVVDGEWAWQVLDSLKEVLNTGVTVTLRFLASYEKRLSLIRQRAEDWNSFHTLKRALLHLVRSIASIPIPSDPLSSGQPAQKWKRKQTAGKESSELTRASWAEDLAATWTQSEVLPWLWDTFADETTPGAWRQEAAKSIEMLLSCHNLTAAAVRFAAPNDAFRQMSRGLSSSLTTVDEVSETDVAAHVPTASDASLNALFSACRVARTVRPPDSFQHTAVMLSALRLILHLLPAAESSLAVHGWLASQDVLWAWLTRLLYDRRTAVRLMTVETISYLLLATARRQLPIPVASTSSVEDDGSATSTADDALSAVLPWPPLSPLVSLVQDLSEASLLRCKAVALLLTLHVSHSQPLPFQDLDRLIASVTQLLTFAGPTGSGLDVDSISILLTAIARVVKTESGLEAIQRNRTLVHLIGAHWDMLRPSAIPDTISGGSSRVVRGGRPWRHIIQRICSAALTSAAAGASSDLGSMELSQEFAEGGTWDLSWEVVCSHSVLRRLAVEFAHGLSILQVKLGALMAILSSSLSLSPPPMLRDKSSDAICAASVTGLASLTLDCLRHSSIIPLLLAQVSTFFVEVASPHSHSHRYGLNVSRSSLLTSYLRLTNLCELIVLLGSHAEGFNLLITHFNEVPSGGLTSEMLIGQQVRACLVAVTRGFTLLPSVFRPSSTTNSSLSGDALLFGAFLSQAVSWVALVLHTPVLRDALKLVSNTRKHQEVSNDMDSIELFELLSAVLDLRAWMESLRVTSTRSERGSKPLHEASQWANQFVGRLDFLLAILTEKQSSFSFAVTGHWLHGAGQSVLLGHLNAILGSADSLNSPTTSPGLAPSAAAKAAVKRQAIAKTEANANSTVTASRRPGTSNLPVTTNRWRERTRGFVWQGDHTRPNGTSSGASITSQRTSSGGISSSNLRELPVVLRRNLFFALLSGRSVWPRYLATVEPIEARRLADALCVLFKHFIRLLTNTTELPADDSLFTGIWTPTSEQIASVLWSVVVAILTAESTARLYFLAAFEALTHAAVVTASASSAAAVNSVSGGQLLKSKIISSAVASATQLAISNASPGAGVPPSNNQLAQGGGLLHLLLSVGTNSGLHDTSRWLALHLSTAMLMPTAIHSSEASLATNYSTRRAVCHVSPHLRMTSTRQIAVELQNLCHSGTKMNPSVPVDSENVMSRRSMTAYFYLMCMSGLLSHDSVTDYHKSSPANSSSAVNKMSHTPRSRLAATSSSSSEQELVPFAELLGWAASQFGSSCAWLLTRVIANVCDPVIHRSRMQWVNEESLQFLVNVLLSSSEVQTRAQCSALLCLWNLLQHSERWVAMVKSLPSRRELVLFLENMESESKTLLATVNHSEDMSINSEHSLEVIRSRAANAVRQILA